MTLFAPPKDITATVWSRMPDSLRRPGARPAWAAVNVPSGEPVDCFLEGPVFDRHGNLYVVNLPFGEIFEITPDGEWSLAAEYDGWPNGLDIHKDGRIFVADYKHGIMVVDPVKGSVEPFLENRWSESFRGCNELHFAMNGDLYFTDQGQTGLHDPTGRVYRWREGEGLRMLIGNGPSPNGLITSPGDNVLYVGMTRDNAAWRVPLLPDGSTTKVSRYVQLSGGWGGPDGLAMDETGGLLISHVGLGSVWHFDPLGQPLHRIRSPEGILTTNCCFGGPENRSLFITESETGTILRADLPVAGAPKYARA